MLGSGVGSPGTLVGGLLELARGFQGEQALHTMALAHNISRAAIRWARGPPSLSTGT